MRTQIQLVKASVDTLDLIIKKMTEASETWRKELETIRNSQTSDETDERLLVLSQRIKTGSETIRVFVADFKDDAESLCSVLTNSHTLFKGEE